ncbi:MAG: hypothetical protein AABN33_24520 [Acidobacteriota bacterium]
MTSAHVTSSIVLAVFMFLLTGCKAKETASNTAAKSTPSAVSNASSTDNSNQPVQPPDANRNADVTKKSETSDSAKTKASPQLLGTYESREVQNEGVVTVISELKTIWVFFADGKYSRVSQVKGKTYHSDSGMFRIEPPDKLVLTIQTTGQRAKQKIQNPPVEKSHIFSLSPDGDELRLTSTKGSIGIFRRVPNPS